MTTPILITMNSKRGASRFQWGAQRSYYAEVRSGSLDEQSQLVKQVMQFAFDTLGAHHLDVRVFDIDQGSHPASEQSRADRRAHHARSVAGVTADPNLWREAQL
jgi:hypothetical protein